MNILENLAHSFDSMLWWLDKLYHFLFEIHPVGEIINGTGQGHIDAIIDAFFGFIDILFPSISIEYLASLNGFDCLFGGLLVGVVFSTVIVFFATILDKLNFIS